MRHPFEHFKRLKVAADVLQLDFGDYEAGVIELRASDSMAISIVLQALAAASVGPLQRTKTGSLWNSGDRRRRAAAAVEAATILEEEREEALQAERAAIKAARSNAGAGVADL